MFDSIINSLYLKLWAGSKKVGPRKEVLLTKRCETYGGVVFDLKWTLKYIHSNGRTSHSVNFSERANSWNLRKVILRIEKEVLPKEIDALIRRHTHEDGSAGRTITKTTDFTD